MYPANVRMQTMLGLVYQLTNSDQRPILNSPIPTKNNLDDLKVAFFCQAESGESINASICVARKAATSETGKGQA